MDIKKQKKPTVFTNKKSLLLLMFAVVFLSFMARGFLTGQNPNLLSQSEIENLTITPVNMGNMQFSVEGIGKLIPAQENIISLSSDSTIQEIRLKAGSEVKKGDVILIAGNPDLALQVEQFQSSKLQAERSLQKARLELDSSVLAEEFTLNKIKAELNIKIRQYEAEEKLSSDGIITALSFERTKTEVAVLKQNITFQQKRMKQLERLFQQTIRMKESELTEAKQALKRVQQRFNNLVVKAPINGIIQKLYVQVGKTVPSGHPLALIGDTNSLIAEIKVPQTKIVDVQLGQTALIDTRIDVLTGKVNRISPSVENGSVAVELSIDSVLPSSARPLMSVEGSIQTRSHDNALFLNKPNYIRNLQVVTLYKFIRGTSELQPVQVTLGDSNGKSVEVLEGLTVNDEIVQYGLPKRFTQEDQS